MSEDRFIGWTKGEIEDFYDLVDTEAVREKELEVDYVDDFNDESFSVVDLAAREKTWKFGHVIVDEAQELSPMQWRMIKRRARNGVTIVGDLAQRSQGGVSSWDELVGDAFEDYEFKQLTYNYRSSSEINSVAQKVLKKMDLDLHAGESVRGFKGEVDFIESTDGEDLLKVLEGVAATLESNQRLALIVADSTVVGDDLFQLSKDLDFEIIDARSSKGLEFDAVVIAYIEDFLDSDHGLNAFYVAVTRATEKLIVACRGVVPDFLV